MQRTKEFTMNKAVLFPALGVLALAAATAARAEETGRVISSTPVIQQVAVPQQVCNPQPVAVQPQGSGGGALVGAIIGGVLGNTIGHGFGRAAATGVGMVAGSAIGDNLERGPNQVAYAQQCATQTTYENRTVGYNVQYEYGGRQYTAQLPYDPGPTIRVNVTPVAGGPVDAAQPLASAVPPPQGQAPEAVILSQPQVAAAYPVTTYPAYGYAPAYPVYPAYAPQPYMYPPVGLSLGIGYVHHHRRH